MRNRCSDSRKNSSHCGPTSFSRTSHPRRPIRLCEGFTNSPWTGQKRIFLSWDSASWHASISLYKIVDEINSDTFRNRHKTALVELMPLPSGAQFLNVIESVFSGMARAILHNSNYGSVQECKAAINMYFAERNQTFLKHPRRAGNKIWGKEQVEAVLGRKTIVRTRVGASCRGFPRGSAARSSGSRCRQHCLLPPDEVVE
jgi:hypothetical protein